MTTPKTPGHIHHCVIGPHCSGKTLWAREVAKTWRDKEAYDDHDKILHLARLEQLDVQSPPFRAPHHTCSLVAITGRLEREWYAQPGEVSLAHGGVLFMDEGAEFKRTVIEQVVRLAGDEGTLVNGLPHDFTLVVALAPCPCGRLGYEGTVLPGYTNPLEACRCDPKSVERYQARQHSMFGTLPVYDVLTGEEVVLDYILTKKDTP
jgi:magnesium chelatase family protein